MMTRRELIDFVNDRVLPGADISISDWQSMGRALSGEKRRILVVAGAFPMWAGLLFVSFWRCLWRFMAGPGSLVPWWRLLPVARSVAFCGVLVPWCYR